MITSLSGSFSGIIAYRDNTSKPFRGTFDSRFQEFDPQGLSAAIDALSNVDVVDDVTPLIPITGSFVGVPPGTTVAVKSQDILNLTVDGPGFYILNDPDTGVNVYARNVLMRLTPGDFLQFGKYSLQPQVTLPPGTSNIFVGVDGIVSVVIAPDPSLIQIGQIQLASFTTPPTDIGGGIFEEGASPPIYQIPGDPSVGFIKQGFTEQRNLARTDTSDVVLQVDGIITRDNGPKLAFAVIYEFGSAVLVGSEEAIQLIRTDSQGFLTQFNKMLQNATGDPNLAVN